MGFETPIEIARLGRRNGQQVTASQLVRSFGIWQERAGREPVFVQHRGRDKLVLASIEQFESWRSASAPSGQQMPAIDEVLDGFAVPMMTMTETGNVLQANLAARPLLDDTGGWLEHVRAAAASVARHRIPERLVLRGGPGEAAVFEVLLRPWLNHVLIRIDNGSLSQRLQDQSSALEAIYAALAHAAPDVAQVVLTPRGYLEAPSAGLAAMTGLPIDALQNTRFLNLIDIATRVDVADAIDRTFRTGAAARVSAQVRVNRADPVGVAIGMAPVHQAAAIGALQIILARTADNRPALIHS